MTNKIENLKDLLVEEGKELYNSVQQELKVLPKLEKAVTSPELRKLIQKQISISESQQKYVADAFGKLSANCKSGKCETTQSILKHSQERIKKSIDAEVRDAGIINSLQHLSHHKIAGYGSSAAYANQIGRKDAAALFHKALEEEKKMDSELSQLAEHEVNQKAATVFA